MLVFVCEMWCVGVCCTYVISVCVVEVGGGRTDHPLARVQELTQLVLQELLTLHRKYESGEKIFSGHRAMELSIYKNSFRMRVGQGW